MLQLNAILNLGADAEAKTINERQYLSFRGASTEKKNGQDVVTWVSVLAGYNENLLPYLKKGQQVFVSGRMSAGIYQSQQNFGIDISVFAQTLQLCGGKQENRGTGSPIQNESGACPQGSTQGNGLSNGNTMTTAIPQPNTNGINTGQTVAPPAYDTPFPPMEEQKDDLPF